MNEACDESHVKQVVTRFDALRHLPQGFFVK